MKRADHTPVGILGAGRLGQAMARTARRAGRPVVIANRRGPESLTSLGDGRFRAVLTPAMDETNRRQFRGCVEDFMIDHVQIDVIQLTVAP
jgi:lactate dehydrogenase-like 2-hydroxyacid dehydrogenase